MDRGWQEASHSRVQTAVLFLTPPRNSLCSHHKAQLLAESTFSCLYKRLTFSRLAELGLFFMPK